MTTCSHHTVIHYCAIYSSYDELKLLVSHIEDREKDEKIGQGEKSGILRARFLDATSTEGETALHYAIRAKDPIMCRILMNYSCNMLIRNNKGQTGAILCRSLGYIDIADWLDKKVYITNTKLETYNDTQLEKSWRYSNMKLKECLLSFSKLYLSLFSTTTSMVNNGGGSGTGDGAGGFGCTPDPSFTTPSIDVLLGKYDTPLGVPSKVTLINNIKLQYFINKHHLIINGHNSDGSNEIYQTSYELYLHYLSQTTTTTNNSNNIYTDNDIQSAKSSNNNTNTYTSKKSVQVSSQNPVLNPKNPSSGTPQISTIFSYVNWLTIKEIKIIIELYKLLYIMIDMIKHNMIPYNIDIPTHPLSLTPLICATILNCPKALKLICTHSGAGAAGSSSSSGSIGSGSGSSRAVHQTNGSGTTPLMIAAQLHNMDVLIDMLSQYKSNSTTTNSNTNNSGTNANANSNAHAGSDIHAVDTEGYSALAYANSIPEPVIYSREMLSVIYDEHYTDSTSNTNYNTDNSSAIITPTQVLKAALSSDNTTYNTLVHSYQQQRQRQQRTDYIQYTPYSLSPSSRTGTPYGPSDTNTPSTSTRPNFNLTPSSTPTTLTTLPSKLRTKELLESKGLTNIQTSTQLSKELQSLTWRLDNKSHYERIQQLEIQNTLKTLELQQQLIDDKARKNRLRCPVCTLIVPCSHYFNVKALEVYLQSKEEVAITVLNRYINCICLLAYVLQYILIYFCLTSILYFVHTAIPVPLPRHHRVT